MQRLIALLLAIVLTAVSLWAPSPLTAQAGQSVDSAASQDWISSRTAFGAPPVNPRASLDLVAEYTFDPTGTQAADWTIGRDGRAGKRLSFLLTPTRIKTYAEPSLVKTAVNHRRPVIWLNRNEDQEPYTYTLVVIGDPGLLLGLQMERAGSLQTIIPNLPTEVQQRLAKEVKVCPRSLPGSAGTSGVPVESLAVGRATNATLHGELVGRDGAFVPVSISHVDFQPDAELAQLCYNSPGFVLLAPSFAGWQDYQLHMVLAHNIAGPPGEGWPVLCSGWQRGNWWTRFISALYGC